MTYDILALLFPPTFAFLYNNGPPTAAKVRPATVTIRTWVQVSCKWFGLFSFARTSLNWAVLTGAFFLLALFPPSGFGWKHPSLSVVYLILNTFTWIQSIVMILLPSKYGWDYSFGLLWLLSLLIIKIVCSSANYLALSLEAQTDWGFVFHSDVFHLEILYLLPLHCLLIHAHSCCTTSRIWTLVLSVFWHLHHTSTSSHLSIS